MFSNAVLLVCLGLLVWMVIFPFTPWGKEQRKRDIEERKRDIEEEQRIIEEQRIKELEEKEQLKNFCKQHFVVYIREKDGRKSAFEAVLIKALVMRNATIESLRENDGQELKNGNTESLENGLLALVGTSWHTSETSADHEAGIMHHFESTHCDYRLLARSGDGKAKILGAGCESWDFYHEDTLAKSIIEELAFQFSQKSLQHCVK